MTSSIIFNCGDKQSTYLTLESEGPVFHNFFFFSISITNIIPLPPPRSAEWYSPSLLQPYVTLTKEEVTVEEEALLHQVGSVPQTLAWAVSCSLCSSWFCSSTLQLECCKFPGEKIKKNRSFYSPCNHFFFLFTSINKKVRNKEGQDMIPNWDFWTSLPGYIKVCERFFFSTFFFLILIWFLLSGWIFIYQRKTLLRWFFKYRL